MVVELNLNQLIGKPLSRTAGSDSNTNMSAEMRNLILNNFLIVKNIVGGRPMCRPLHIFMIRDFIRLNLISMVFFFTNH